ncbi:MAG: error-prone DNA polymerase [Alphaproteobacteria bacterium]|nr:error-prone DNA polymerase [Alphaproteobacteria bacterium]MBU0795356.1 error-prone DNA polymerase [Alphaproteobacteria bacterium]MBU0877476.1 error-prone DNA polymerase [Alphaproteobacteria bacterium]MBU1770343.1 error-prone DNA polymerase [Alphaproteobacteria bacterium]
MSAIPATTRSPCFAELIAATSYSFLRGSAHPADMVTRAISLGYKGIGIADRNTVAGVVRAYAALRDFKAKLPPEVLPAFDFRLVVGARLVFADGTPDIIAYPVDRAGWGRLTRLLTLGNRRADKGQCTLYIADLIEHAEGLLLIAIADESHEFLLRRLAGRAPLWIAATMARRGDDQRRLARLQALSARTGIALLATNDALYATAEQRPLHDIVTCIREGTTIAGAGTRLLANAERHLKSPSEMARLFQVLPQALTASTDILSRIGFTLDELRYQYPREPVPKGWKPLPWLKHLTMQAVEKAYPDGIPRRIRNMLRTEFRLIRKRRYACYFLTVYELVKFARSLDPPILCQGRGSAANSAVCYFLGITSVDPARFNLLFSRFVSAERNEPPDIDVDFEHERREEVIQHIYERYGRSRAGIAATVIHYRPKSAVREVGKVLGLSEDVTARLTSTVWGSHAGAMEAQRVANAGFDPNAPELVRLRWLVDQLLDMPRHLSQHVGGFVLTQGRLDELVPIHNAAMEGRTFIEWDKDDIDALGLMKVDVLALGMLSCIRKAFEMMRAHGFADLTLASVPQEVPAVYDMLCKGDSVGVFQVESRAQINMLPRLKPRKFYDLAVQVAIVRPGPIEGDMVHPYLKRRSGKEAVEFPAPAPPHDPDELRGVLGDTYGVPLFQEQAMKLAITAAGFTSGEANQLRRAMATFRHVGTIDNFERKMIEGMVARGYQRDFAQRCYNQIKGFGSYGFPESHAISFALLVYVSAWLKCAYPAVFAASLLNAQPMGFYAPAQIVRDAHEHGVDVRAIDINHSDWDNRLESGAVDSEVHERWNWGVTASRLDKGHALRLGFRQIDGFHESWGRAIVAERQARGAFASMEELGRRVRVRQQHGQSSESSVTTPLPARALRLLANADACRSLGMERRTAAWEVRRIPEGRELPLFAAADARELAAEPNAALPAMPLSEEVATDYQTTRLSLKQHPMHFLRETLRAERILSSAELLAAPDGRRVKAAGVVLIRQRPGKGNAIFVTLEDETGIVNVLLWARLFERYRRPLMASRLMEVHGKVQKSAEGVMHLMADRIMDRSALLDRLNQEEKRQDLPGTALPGPIHSNARHPRDVRIIPKSRDFH